MGVPLIVIVLAFHEAVTPAGRPVGVPIPDAPVVAIVTGVRALLTHTVGLADGVPAVLSWFTVMTMLFEFTVAADTQAALLVMLQDTTSPLFNDDVV